MPNLDTILSFPSGRSGSSFGGERTPIPPRCSHILVTDTTDAPALFVLVHFLRASHAINKLHRSAPSADRKGKGKAHSRVIWVGCNSDGFVHLSNVARRSGVHLDEEVRNGAFVYVDANEVAIGAVGAEVGGIEAGAAAMSFDEQGQRRSAAEHALQQLYGKLSRELINTNSSESIEEAEETGWTSRCIIVVDDLTALAWALDPTDSSGRPVDIARQLNNWVAALTSLASKVSIIADPNIQVHLNGIH